MSRDGHLVMEHSIDQIEVGHTYRHDLGELADLVESIRRVGLIVPISITTDNVLISGRRRLAALKALGVRVAPVWIVTGVSDKLSMVLAIQDAHTLQKLLTPIEQAELYGELSELLAEENARKQKATRFGSRPSDEPASPATGSENPDATVESANGGQDGGVDSTPPSCDTARAGGKTRVQAAIAVTGHDSHSSHEQVIELRTIAASEQEDPEIRQAAAEALIELNADGKINGRYLRVKILQALAALRRTADDPAESDAVRHAAAAELESIQGQQSPKDALREANRAVAHLAELRRANTAGPGGWSDADPLLRQKHQNRRLVDLLRREHGWWDRFDPGDFGRYAEPEQWELVETYIAGATGFLDAATAARVPETADAVLQ